VGCYIERHLRTARAVIARTGLLLSLARLLAPIDPIADALDCGPEVTDDPQWLRADGWRVLARIRQSSVPGVEFQRFALPDGRLVSATFDSETRRIGLPFDPNDAYSTLVSEGWRRGVRVRELSSSNLALYYRIKTLIPRGVQLRARRVLARWQGVPEFPAWPFEPSVVELLRFYVRCLLLGSGRTSLRFRWFWPDRKAAALMLTHDVESADGLRMALELASMEEERGFRSSFNVVGSWYPIDMGIVGELRQRGFEIGVHGVYHDRSMFSSREAFESQQSAVREAAERFGAVGFRSPATHRVFEWLADLPLLYDCSIPHSDPYEPQPGGCCSIWPFFIGNVVELPYTLPQDHTLFNVLQQKTIDVWLRQVDELVNHKGLIQSVTHPDPGYIGDENKRRLYAEFLDALRQRPDVWFALPRDISTWWRQRDAGNSTPFPTVAAVARLVGDNVELAPVRGADMASS
jgi:peptidoglycan/xylan/chitin deacetylase (PgdA/CDA1 family)